MLRYLRLAWRFFALNVAREMQYRAHFMGTVISGIAHTCVFLIFIETVLANVHSIGIWTRPQMYVVYGTFVFVQALAQFAVEPNINALTDGVRQGELDLILTKPVDSQLYISLRAYSLPALANVFLGCIIVMYGVAQSAVHLTGVQVVAYFVLLVCAFVIVYSLWLLSVLYVFKAIRVDSFAVLFVPILQFARYPISAYSAFMQKILRYVLPLVFVATVPAETLLGLTDKLPLISAIVTAMVCLVAVRAGWLLACRNYTSASS